MAEGPQPLPEAGSWLGRRVLVSGWQGFLGSWLARALAARGASVVGLSRHALRVGDAGIVPVIADLTDRATLEPVFAGEPFDTVFHLAAQTLPTFARQNPELTFDINTRGSWNLLEAARQARTVPRIVFSSTDSVYGENGGEAFVEAAPLAPTFPYETSKACAELVARCYSRTYGMQIAFARFCNIYGPGDVAASRLMAGTIAAALAGERQHLRGGGQAVRNYLYVEDAVSALLVLAQRLGRNDLSGEAFNFCDETPYSVAEIVERILALAGRPDLKPHFGAGTPGEISIKRATAAKARDVLGWHPQVPLEEGLRRTIAWHRAREAAAARSTAQVGA